MLVTLLGMKIEDRLLQSEKVLFSILLTPGGKIASVRPLAKKDDLPILVTLSGTVTDTRLVQLANAESPILVTLEGIVTAISLTQSKNV